MKGTMKWHEGCAVWILTDSKGNFMQRFEDCINIKAIFPNLKREQENTYRIETQKL